MAKSFPTKEELVLAIKEVFDFLKQESAGGPALNAALLVKDIALHGHEALELLGGWQALNDEVRILHRSVGLVRATDDLLELTGA